MGTLIYGGSSRFDLDDRTLEHVKVVVVARLRKRESFMLSLPQRGPFAVGSSSVWISPDVPIGFQFSSSRAGPLSRRWIQALMAMSYAPGGLAVVPEGGAGPPESRPDDLPERAAQYHLSRAGASGSGERVLREDER
ncbi:hypothetical protein J4H92_12230 [Leucobacter weissii]|uniref:DUF7882 domain-containing protein n=1 Tax=Leucobacter weissii TaxID=1983706 RepID=A0A939MKM0_9MICO|nr:hypothetical protein [Leucobacter weissii]MBO1902714.1 hypothetical protein [Leucobacter weissii]